MQAAKTLLTLLAVGLCVGSVSQARPDTESQAKAREATRQKIAELEGKPVAATPAAPAPAAAPAPTAAPVPPAPAAVPAAAAPAAAAARFSEVPAAGTVTPEQIERLREATRQKIAEENAAGAEAKRLAQEEKARKKAEAEEEEAKALAAQPKATSKAPAFDPIPAPPTNISAPKETRLADLLKKYKADEITPEQYHQERAKILAEP